MRLFVSVLFVFFFLLATGDFLFQEINTDQEKELSTQDAGLRYAHGYEIYTTYCKNCHGKRGDGNGFFSGLSPDQDMPDFRDASFKRSKESLRRVIQEGGTTTGLDPMMPGWKTVLSNEEIDQVTYFIHRLNQEGEIRPGLRTTLATTDILQN